MIVQICSNDYFLKSLQKELLAEEILRVYDFLGFPGGASGKEPTCQCRRCKRHGFDPWVENDPLEKGMATHFSILAWRIQWTEEPGGLQSIGSQRVRRD